MRRLRFKCAVGVAVASAVLLAPLAATAGPVVRIGPTTQISSCAGPNAEPVSAVDGRYVYVAWIGCASAATNIAVATSSDGGATFAAPVLISPSPSSWDPTLAVGPDHHVYLAYMVGRVDCVFTSCSSVAVTSPYVAVSTNHGASFSAGQPLYQPVAPTTSNFADRPFIAIAPDGTIAMSYDFGPGIAPYSLLCAKGQNCSFAAGQYNAVVQISHDGGATWSNQIPIDPRYPIGGEWSAALVAEPNDTFDALMWDHLTDPTTYAMSSGPITFSHSGVDGLTWSTPSVVSAAQIPLSTWWVDGSIGIDAGGTLYAAWDAQGEGGDTPYLAYSSNDGQSWSAPIAVAPGSNACHLVAIVGGAPGTAFVAMQTGDAVGYRTKVTGFSVSTLRLAPWQSVSPILYDPSVWPGDTVGLSYRGASRVSAHLFVNWGGALMGSSSSEIWGSGVNVILRKSRRPRSPRPGESHVHAHVGRGHS